MSASPKSATQSGALGTRRRILAAGVVVAVVAGVAGWVAALQIKSPAEVASETDAPRPSVITATVESRVLSSDVVARGTVVATDTVQVGTTGPRGVLAPIVTRVPVRAGQAVAPGSVLIEVAGRPLFLLPGVLPAYRDLREGDVGPDVVQLQEALRRAGESTAGDEKGRFGSQTSAALGALYVRAGYAPQSELPASEVAYVSEESVRVQAVNVRRGDSATMKSVTLSTGGVQVVSTVDGSQQALLRPPMSVQIYSEVLDKHLVGTLKQIATSPPPGFEPQGVATGDGYAIIRPKGDAQDFIGQDVRVTFNAGRSSGDVLSVPVSAVYSTVDGQTSVLVVGAGGRQVRVEVKVGITTAGVVEVTAVAGGTLKAGDQVVVGSR